MCLSGAQVREVHHRREAEARRSTRFTEEAQSRSASRRNTARLTPSRPTCVSEARATEVRVHGMPPRAFANTHADGAHVRMLFWQVTIHEDPRESDYSRESAAGRSGVTSDDE